MLSMFGGQPKKNVVLLGCGGTLGTAFAHAYSDVYNIIGVARNEPANLPSSVSFVSGDISGDRATLVSDILATAGHVDVLINNAVLYDLRRLEEKDSQVFRDELEVGLVGPLDMSNRILDLFWKNEGVEKNLRHDRSILNITSGSGLGVVPNMGQGTYSAIKSAFNMLSKHQALEYEPYGLRVNAVAPGSLLDVATLEQTLKEIAACIDTAGVSGEIRATNGEQTDLY